MSGLTNENVPPEKRHLRAALGMAFGIAASIGATIGVGIFRTPGIIAGHMGSVAAGLAIWFAGAVYVALSVSYTAELATSIPRSGGPYAFAERTLGRYAGSAVGWSDLMNGVYSIAFLCVALAEYIIQLSGAGISPSYLAAGIVVAFTVINLFAVNVGAGAQQALSLAKVTALWLLIVLCFVGTAPAAAEVDVAPRLSPGMTILGSLLAFQIVLGVYTGWRTPSYYAEEAKRPRDLVGGLFIGAGLVALTYIGVNLGLAEVLSFEQLASSKLPAADAAGVALTGWGWSAAGITTVTVLAIVSLPSTIQGVLMSNSRALYAMSEDRLFFKAVARLNHWGSPSRAVMVLGAVTIVLVSTSSFEDLFAAFALFGVLNNFLMVLGALLLRIREPDLPRPYRAFGFPWTFLILLLVDGAVFVGFLFTNLQHALVVVILLLVLFPLQRWGAGRFNSSHQDKTGQ